MKTTPTIPGPPRQGTGSASSFFLILTATCFLLSGCIQYAPLPGPTKPSSPQPTVPDATPPQPTPKQSSPTISQPKVEPEPAYNPKTGAASSLYQQAKSFVRQGKYNQAELALERALRIEPKNGYYWYSLADVKYKQNRRAEAVQLCLKSKSLAGRDKQLIGLNERLIRMAQ